MLRWPTEEMAVAFCETLTIVDERSKVPARWKVNDEQRLIIRAAIRNRRLIVGKGRQIGSTTVFMALLALLALMNPGISIGVFGDDQDKIVAAFGLTIRAWLDPLGVLRKGGNNTTSVTLKNGARVTVRSATSHAGGEQKESKAGRSGSFAIVYCTELAFWNNAPATWAALMGTMPAIVWVDSTGSPGQTTFKDIADGPGWDHTEEPRDVGWCKLFLGVEEHVSYRAPPQSITDEQWCDLAERYGFKRRDSAAWWLAKLTTDIKDAFRMLREFPIVFAHMFMFAVGQHIQRWTEVTVMSAGEWDHYHGAADEPLVMGVDVAKGVGADASAIALLGQRTGALHATYRCNTIDVLAFTALVKATYEKHKPVACIIESNGVGDAVWQAMRSRKGAVEQWSSNTKNGDGELYKRRTALKDAIEKSLVCIGGHLVMECRGSSLGPNGFDGPDDVISALSFAWVWREAHPWKAAPEAVDRAVVFVAPAVGKKKRRR